MPRMHHALMWLLLAWACMGPAVAGPATFEQKLQEADRIRSSDPRRFAALLEELGQEEADARPGQVQRLQYLRAYQAAVYRREPAVAIAIAQQLFREASDSDLRFRAGAFLVNTMGSTREFTSGLRLLNETLPLRDNVRDKALRHDGLFAASFFYNELGQYKLGLQYAQEILADQPAPRARCISTINLLDAQYHLDDLPGDDAPIHRAIQQCVAIGERMAANFNRLVLARKWAQRGETDNAIALLDQHLPEMQDIGYHRLVADVHALLAELRLKKGELDTAAGHARAAVDQAEHVANTAAQVSAYRVLYTIADGRGDPVAAMSFYRRYAEADKAHLTDVQARELAYEIVRHETLQKNQQISLLNQQNQLLLLQQRLDHQAAQNNRLLIAMLVLLLAGIAYWAYRTKRRQLSLRRMAETDALTGISNRQHFTRLSEQSLAQCASAGEPAALLMFDLDHFKTINDSYGHVTGDWVLQQVAEASSSFCRRIDHIGRLGGEEFAILLRGCDLDAATRLAEDCRSRIARLETGESGHAFTVTASFGVTDTSMSGYALMPLLSHADIALYRAKREGRNRVRRYVPDLPAQSPLQIVGGSAASTTATPVPGNERGPLDVRGH